MLKSNRLLLLIFILAAVSLSACSGSSRVAASSWPGVTATESTVYLAFGPHVYALDSADGRVNWKYPVEADSKITFFAAPAVTGDGTQVIAGAYNNQLYNLDARTGALAGWTFTEAGNRYIGDPVILDGNIFAPNADGVLYALGLDGNPLWHSHFDADEPIWASASTDGSNIFIASLNHNIYAVNAKTGEEVWSVDLETASTGMPNYDNGVLYVGTFGSRVFALNASTGGILWKFETKDWVWGSTAVADGILYAGDIGGTLYAIDAATGDQVWTFAADGGIYGGPLVIDGTIYFGTVNGLFYALSNEGAVRWFYPTNGKIYSRPTFNGELLFVATIDSDVLLTALDLNGTARWPFSPGE